MSNRVQVTEYYQFAPEVVDTVGKMYERIDRYDSYGDLFQSTGAHTTKTVLPSKYYPTETQIADIRPIDHDSEEALVVHLPMANPLDENMRYHLASLAIAHKDKRIIATANPSGPGRKFDALSRSRRSRLAGGDFRVASEGLAYFLESEGITRTYEYGYSYGVDKALGNIALDATEAQKVLLLEPASLTERSIGKLGLDFMSSDKAMQGYVEASGLPTYEVARKDAIGPAAYAFGLGRLTNIATARAIARGDFADRFDEVMTNHVDLQAVLAWGTKSELADHDTMSAIALGSEAKHGSHRVEHIKLEGQKHALANHIGLQAALTLEAFKD